MKTPEELKKIRTEFEALSVKLRELTEEELLQVCGGIDMRKDLYENTIIGSVRSGVDEEYRHHSKTKTGDTRGELTPEQRTPAYIHRQIFGKKFDEFFGN